MGEAVLLVLLAIVVVGPRDVPKMMRSLGRTIAKLRRTAFDLRSQSGIDEILQSEGLQREVRDLQKLATGRIMELGLDEPMFPAPGMARPQPEVLDARSDPYQSRRAPPRHREYPPSGPDCYDALPEDAYAPGDPDPVPAEAVAAAGEPTAGEPAPEASETGTPSRSPEGVVARGAGDFEAA